MWLNQYLEILSAIPEIIKKLAKTAKVIYYNIFDYTKSTDLFYQQGLWTSEQLVFINLFHSKNYTVYKSESWVSETFSNFGELLQGE